MQSSKHWLLGYSRNSRWVLQQYKKDPGRNESYTKQNKKTLQGTNSRVDKVENQVNDLEYKEAKNNQSEQQEEKIIQKHKNKLRKL